MHYIRFILIVGVLALTISATNGQGLSGWLNKAKTKVNQTAGGYPTSTDQSIQSAAQDGPPATPPALTPESNGQYTHDLLVYADRQSFHPHGSAAETPSEIYWYCWLRHQGFPIHFAWNQAALVQTADQRVYLSGLINDMTADLVSGLNSKYGPTLKSRLAKVKEIRFATSPKKRSLDDFGTLQGYFFSFEPNTGLLTAAMSTPDGAISISDDLALTKWILKYIK